jgi:hypothetical protein
MDTGCKHIMKAGALRGKGCGKQIFQEEYCKSHYTVIKKQQEDNSKKEYKRQRDDDIIMD